MAVMPGVQYAPIGYAGVNLMQRYDIVCVHTIVGYAPAPAAHFSTAGDGHIWQNRDTRYSSAANYSGNYRVIAVENADHGPEFGAWDVDNGHAVPAFTAAQCESIARIVAWACTTHGIPIQLCPDSRPTSRGVAYHRQGIDGNWSGYAYGGRVPGGEVWTRAVGKVCPGDRRIRQLIDIIIPRARQIAAGVQEVTLSQAEVDQIVAWLRPMYQQLTGGTEIGQYPGWAELPLTQAGNVNSKTLVDYFRVSRAEQRRQSAVQDSQNAALAELIRLHGAGEAVTPQAWAELTAAAVAAAEQGARDGAREGVTTDILFALDGLAARLNADDAEQARAGGQQALDELLNRLRETQPSA